MGTHHHHHHHGHHHHHDHSHGQSSNILFAFSLNFIFSIIEFIGGYITNSVAVTSDALHDLGDSVALLFAYISEKIGEKDPDESYTYGYRRFSTLSALINGVILLSGSCYVIYEAIIRLQNPEPVSANGMILLGVLGISVNALAAYKMSKGQGVNQRMVMLHLLEDLLGWIAVIIVSIVLLFKPWYFLDSLLSILISVMILKGVYSNLMRVGSILLQKFPNEIKMDEIKQSILAINDIKDLHAIRGFAMDDYHFSLSFHVVVPDEMTIGEVEMIKQSIKEILSERNIRYSSIEFESDKTSC